MGGASRNGVSGARGSPGCCPPVPASRPSSLSPAPAPGKERGALEAPQGQGEVFAVLTSSSGPQVLPFPAEGHGGSQQRGEAALPRSQQEHPSPTQFWGLTATSELNPGLTRQPRGLLLIWQRWGERTALPKQPPGLCSEPPTPNLAPDASPPPHSQISGTRPHGRLWTHLNLSCPAVSQNCSLTRSPGSSSTN